jgi:hypothetical protein
MHCCLRCCARRPRRESQAPSAGPLCAGAHAAPAGRRRRRRCRRRHRPNTTYMARLPAAAVAAALLLALGADAAAARRPRVVQIGLAADKALATTSDQFVCWNIDASANRGFFQRDLDVSKPYGKQLAYQAAHMVARQGMGMQRADAFSLLRFGGSGNDALLYEFGDTKCPKPPATPGKHFAGDIKCLNQTWWRNLLGFTNASNARIIFGVSEPKWTGCGQGSSCGPDRKDPCTPCKPWDATNAREILEWTIAQGLDHLIYGFELGKQQSLRSIHHAVC